MMNLDQDKPQPSGRRMPQRMGARLSHILWAGVLCLASLAPLQGQTHRLPKHLFGKVDQAKMHHWADSVYHRLSLEERVAQLIMPVVYPSAQEAKISAEEQRVRQSKWGGILYQKGMVADQALMNARLQRASAVPMLIALDGEWGLYMRLKDAPRAPRNMGLGLYGDNQLLYDYGREIARQCRLVGIHVNFAPDVDVNINPTNPVIGTRSFGEDPKLVAEQSVAYASGLEDGGVLSVAKHFPGHGDTSEDSHKTLPLVSASRKRMQEVELYPFAQYFRAGLGGVMTAHLRVPAYEQDNVPSSLSYKISTELLKEQMKFGGLVFTDGLEMRGVHATGQRSVGTLALLAGNDILLGPPSAEGMLREVVESVRSGRISEELLREKVLKVLYYKWRLIVSQPKGEATPTEVKARVATPEAQRFMEMLWVRSLHHTKPNKALFDALARGQYKRIAVVDLGRNPVEIGARPKAGVGGARIDYLSGANLAQQAGTLSGYDLVLANVFQPSAIPRGALQALMQKTPTIVAFYSSPYKVDAKASYLAPASAVLITMEAAPEAQRAVLSLLTGGWAEAGKVAPTLHQQDEDDPTATPTQTQKPQPSAEAKPQGSPLPPTIGGGASLARLQRIDELIQQGLQDGAFPGAQVVVLHRGQRLMSKAYGSKMGVPYRELVDPSTLYDVASITKALATTPAVMLLVGDGSLSLEGRVGQYLPTFAGTPVGAIKVRDLLLHQSGLPAGLNFFTDLIDSTSYSGELISRSPMPGGIRLHGGGYGNPHFGFLPQYVSKTKDEAHPLSLARGLYLSPSFKAVMMERLGRCTVRQPASYRYSDLNFVLLQQIVEAVSGEGMDALLERRIYRPIGAKVYFNPLEQGIALERIAPSQRDDFFRKQVIQGTVDDETAACLGGVSGNAGLFASAEELAKVAQLLLDKGSWQGKQIIPSKVVEQFARTSGLGGRRWLGFDRQTGKSNSPTAESASSKTFGHLGFTGTAVWVDPEHQLVFVFLSNRTYPSRHNKRLGSERYRPRLHQLVYEALGVNA